MKRTLLYVALPLALVGCGKSDGYAAKQPTKVREASVKPGEEATIFPLEVGNQWVYTVESRQGKGELTLKVTDVQKEGDATTATITSSFTGGTPSESTWRVDKTGVYQVSDGPNRAFDPPQLLVAFPLDESKTNQADVTGPYPVGQGSGPMKTTTKYVGMQQVDTDMERLNALAVESITVWTTPDGQAVSRGMTWWTPGIGFVRQRQEAGLGQNSTVVLIKLKSYSFK
jgi:hypothetical protein